MTSKGKENIRKARIKFYQNGGVHPRGMLGKTAWNKNKKMPEISGENNHNWKGEEASYFAKHNWIKRHRGTPNFCEHCKRNDIRMYHWSNISGKYKRIFKDWQRLCVPCHSKYDRENKL